MILNAEEIAKIAAGGPHFLRVSISEYVGRAGHHVNRAHTAAPIKPEETKADAMEREILCAGECLANALALQRELDNLMAATAVKP